MGSKLVLASALVLSLIAGCGGGGGSTPMMVVPTATTLPANATTTDGVTGVPFTFATGVSQLGTSGSSTTVTITDKAAAPAFSIAAGGNTASGTTTFGSCIFHVTTSTFPEGSILAAGNTVTVDPCTLKVDTANELANGTAQQRTITLILGTGQATATVNVQINPNGELIINGEGVGTVTVVPVTGT